MDREKSYFGRISRLIHQRFLLLLLTAYVAAAIAPCVGVAARGVTLGTIVVMGERVAMTLPMLLLATLLLNAGLSAEVSELAGVVKRPHLVLAGLAINLLVPLGFIALLFQTIRFWHNPEETQNLLVGLAVIAAMPVAGSSTAWSLSANGNMGLSLALVILSTALSPITTPLVLLAVGSMASGPYAETLHDLSGYGTGTILLLCVVIPSLAGVLLRPFFHGPSCLAWIRRRMQLLNSLVLLFLCYANAAVSLPQVLREPDWDYLLMILVGVTFLCLAAFLDGWTVGQLLNVDDSQRKSLVFGLGMNNNGTGMVLASTSLASLPYAILPVLMHNLVQHLVASSVKWFADRAVNLDFWGKTGGRRQWGRNARARQMQ
jgi:BASS family bile acid:Na+ symporter